MKLIVGLGNPGTQYAGNRHNVGFMAAERIAAAHGASSWRKRFQGDTCDANIGDEKVLLLKPATYMNDSGLAVGEAMRFHKIEIGDVIVLYDEIDLAPGKLKVKTGGGNAGHNGLRSISAHVGNDYVRVRIGVGHPGRKDLVANYVLHDFAKADRVWLDPLLDAIAARTPSIVAGDTARFLSDIALDTGSEPAKADAPPAKKGKPKAPSQRDLARNAAAPDEDPPSPAAPAKTNPARERQSKRATALAENLKKWMQGRRSQ